MLFVFQLTVCLHVNFLCPKQNPAISILHACPVMQNTEDPVTPVHAPISMPRMTIAKKYEQEINKKRKSGQ
jgi:hypothetical protein